MRLSKIRVAKYEHSATSKWLADGFHKSTATPTPALILKCTMGPTEAH
jgi:hypothetical protein